MRNFTIKDSKSSITIETDKTRYDAIEHIVMSLFRYYRDVRPERLDKLVGLINVAYEGVKISKS